MKKRVVLSALLNVGVFLSYCQAWRRKKKEEKKEKLSSATQGDKLYLAGNSGFPGAFLISPSSKMGITYLIHVEWRCLIPQQRGEVCACQLHKYVDSKLFLNALRNLFEDVQQIMD